MQLNRLCFKPPANFLDDDHKKASIKTSKPSSIEFQDAEGMQLLEKVGVDHPRIFSYAELFVGSNGFSVDRLLGSGGFGKVYRAVLPSDGTTVAVKCLIERGRSIEKTFAAELVAVANLRHRNLVRLRGWSIHDDQLLLVYDYMPNLSLSRVLFKQKGDDNGRTVLSWERRKKIATGLAAALFYLHDQLETQILHRDVKASNVMLDADFNARLGDFGLARWIEHDMKYQTTPSMRIRVFRVAETSKIGGTMGYIPPENFHKQVVSTAKSDVFSFGIVALEIATGRRAIDLSYPEDEIILLDWIRSLSDQESCLQAVDVRLPGGSYNVLDMERLIHIGLLCTLHDPQSRPTMKWVLDALSDTIFFKLPDLPAFKSHPQYISMSSTDTSRTKSMNTLQFSSTYGSNTTIFTSSNFEIVKGHPVFPTAEDENIRVSRNSVSNSSQHCHIPRIDTPKEIPLKEILRATHNFSDSHRVAEADFGTAYHGFLGNSHQVIIKRLATSKCPSMLQVFSNEIKNLARLRHRNLVQLRGWCSDLGEMIVVYDYTPRNILSHFLFHYNHKDTNCKLKWHHRYNTIKSLASAVYYLHEGWDEQVIHRCITSSTIILDPDMNARLGSFALAEFFSRNDHAHNKVDKKRSFRGLFGYMAPEYMETGEATTMADIYSFGIVLLELVTGQRAVDFRYPGGLLARKVHKFESQKRPYKELADPRLDGDYIQEELIRVIKLGIACTVSNPKSRPSIRHIMSILDGHHKCTIENTLKKESRREWKRRNASSLYLVRRIQALGIQ